MPTELRVLVRRLVRRPAATAAAVAVLAVAIAANGAIFSLLDGIVLRPLPYPDAERLVELGTPLPGLDALQEVSWPKLVEVERAGAGFAALAADVATSVAVSARGEVEEVDGARVSDGFFAVWGVRPLRGRVFSAEEQRPGGADVVMLSEGYWQRRFGGDPRVVGRTLTVDGRPAAVVGIVPASFGFPYENVSVWQPRPDQVAFLPPEIVARGAGYLHVVGRLAPGVALEAASTAVSAASARYANQYPGNFDALYDLRAVPLADQLFGATRATLLVLLAAVGLMLLVACADIATLRLVHGLARRREVAARIALGAEPHHLVAVAAVEGLLLAGAGGLLGLPLAWATLRLLVATRAAELPRLSEVTLSAPAVAVTFAAVGLATLLASLAPAVQAVRTDPRKHLVEAGRGGAGPSAGTRRAQSALVAAQVAMALVLVTAAGLMLHSFERVLRIDLGFVPDDMTVASFTLPEATHPDAASRHAFFDALVERLRGAPDVDGAAVVDYTPVLGAPHVRVAAEGSELAAEEMPIAMRVLAGDGYLRTLGARFRAGADFDRERPEDAAPEAILDGKLAAMLFGGADPIGRRVHVRGVDGAFEVVGIVDAVQQPPLEQPKEPTLFLSWRQVGRELSLPNFSQVVVRSRLPAAEIASRLRTMVAEIDPGQAVPELTTLRSTLERAAARRRLATGVFAAFALLALGLALLGIAAVSAHGVIERRRELGLRLALGATPAKVVRGVLLRGARPIALGLLLGVTGSWISGRLLASQLYRVEATDPLHLVVSLVAVAAVALFAALLPAMRAGEIDPAESLRAT